MPLSLFVLFLLLAAGNSCETSSDCSLNGDCLNGSCECDPWWSGSATCDVLALLPADKLEGYHNSSGIASWGGMSIRVKTTWHFFAAEMLNYCGLQSWKNNSRVIRGMSTSGSAGGPFDIVQAVSVPFSHNPKVFEAPDGKFLLFSIGTGLWQTTPIQCAPPSSSIRLDEAGEAREQSSAPPAVPYPGPCGDGCGPGDLNGGCGLSLGVADSIEGPWTFTPIVIQDQNASTLLDCAHTNPSPWIFPNGSILMAINAGYCHSNTETIGLLHAPSWAGPWTFWETGPILFNSDGSFHTCEDPFLWVTERGFHLMLHNFGSTVALYAHSVDARNWTLHDEPGNPGPYTDLIQWSDGTSDSFDVERPQFVFEPESGRPLYLTNGAQGNPASFTLYRPLAQTPPPPPPPPARLLNAVGQCLSTTGPFPCYNATGLGVGICPLLAADCSSGDGDALWIVDAAKQIITSASIAGAAPPPINIDCDACDTGAIAKIITSGSSPLSLDATTRQIRVLSCTSPEDMCLTTGAAAGAKPPCGGGDEPWLPTQIHLAPCADAASTVGWELSPL